MLNANDVRTNAAAAAEENKAKFEQEVTALVDEKIAKVVEAAAADGLMSVGVTLKSCDKKVAAAAIEMLSQGGFDVAVAADASSDDGPGQIVFTLYWSKDRGGNPGNVTRPKMVVIA